MKKIYLLFPLLVSCSINFNTSLNNSSSLEEPFLSTISQNEESVLSSTSSNNNSSILSVDSNKPYEEIRDIGNIVSSKDYFDECSSNQYYHDLFSLDNKVVFKLDIPSSQLSYLEDNYKSSTYVKAKSLTILIYNNEDLIVEKTIYNVGVRMKGNTTRNSFFDKNKKEIYNLSHYKISFQETFEDAIYGEYQETYEDTIARENRKNRTFFGLKAMELKYNAEGDLTYTRDIYSSLIYRKYGIYAQRTTLGVLSFNIDDEDKGTLGVYKLYEPVDNIFVKRYFSKNNNDGDLFKCSWGRNVGMPNLNNPDNNGYGVDESTNHDEKYITYALKTNKKKSDLSSIRSFLNWINSEVGNLSNSLSTYMNEDYFLLFLAINYLSGDWDNFMYDSNNYYLYFDEAKKAYFIPYDMDRTYGLQAKNHQMAYKTPLDNWNLQGGNRSNLLIKTIDKSDTFKEKYKNVIKEIAPSILKEDLFKEAYEKIFNHYQNDFLPTMTSLKFKYDQNTTNQFYHLIQDKYISYNDSSSFNHAFTSYIEKKLTVVKENC